MGWRGLIRDLQAAERQNQREQYRQKRARERQQRDDARNDEWERVSLEVEEFQNLIQSLVSIHNTCNPEVNWRTFQSTPKPTPPQRADDNESRARRAFARFRPSIWDKLLGKTEERLDELQDAILEGRSRDDLEHEAALEEHRRIKTEWDSTRKFASRIVTGDVTAYSTAISDTKRFADLFSLGCTEINAAFPARGTARLDMKVSPEIVPRASKHQLKTGLISIRQIPGLKFARIQQEYVSGCVLRAARETLAFLPITLVLVTAHYDFLNRRTGHLEKMAVLSAAIPRNTVQAIQWANVNSIDTLANFVHRAGFSSEDCLVPVEPLRVSDLSIPT